MQALMSMDEHTMVAPVGSANEDGNGGISHGTLGSVAEHEYYAAVGLGGAAHWDGDGEPNSCAYRSAAEPIDRKPS
jgi:hypothetical protein